MVQMKQIIKLIKKSNRVAVFAHLSADADCLGSQSAISFLCKNLGKKVDNYIDILLFNYKYNCFVVVELKVTELKKEHIGQIKLYMNYIDKHVKNINQDRTIGIIICKNGNEFVMQYCSDDRIFDTNFILN